MDKPKVEDGPVKGGLSAKIRKVEQQTADWLEKSTSHYSKKKWGILLALFIMLVGSISAMLLIGGLTGQLDNAFTLERITKTINAQPTKNESPPKEGLPRAQLQKLEQYRAFLDSLSTDPTGIKKYQQIIRNHPGLSDSLDWILKDCQLQTKNR